MAKRSQPKNKSMPKSKSKSGLFTGIIIGLLVGLAVAVAAALYITKAPVPFMERKSSDIDELLAEDADPNRGLYGNSTAADAPEFQGKEQDIAQELGNIRLPEPEPDAESATAPEPKPESLDTLIADLDNTKPKQKATPSSSTTYFLQAGAFTSAKDAESRRARILLLGLDASIQKGDYNGGTINRVRVGPFDSKKQLQSAQASLSNEKIETSIVRP